MKAIINLDHAAAAPINKEAKKAITKWLDLPVYNIDSSYQPAVEQRRYLADLKSKTAKLLGVKLPNILITSGSSDASSKLLDLISQAEPNKEVILTEIEHSTLLSRVKDFPNHKILKLSDTTGSIKLKDLAVAINDSTILISIQYVNNETGQVLPIKEAAKLVAEVNRSRKQRGIELPLFLHTDASQAAVTEDLNIPRLGVDALSLNGSKLGSLPSCGILYLSADLLRWLYSKGIEYPHQKENPLSIISLYYSLQHSIQKKATENKRLTNLSKAFFQELQKQIPEASLNPKNLKIGKNHAPHILNIHIPKVSGERLTILAGLSGTLISTGAACSASKDRPSHVLQALGLSPAEIQSSIRVSFGSANGSEKEVIKAAKKLAELCNNPSVKL
ncbi:MAG: cysteine desulfurase [Patescibacteria group bacterium]|nr:cysteine desulfurase [Patescibacteria group bacterium]